MLLFQSPILTYRYHMYGTGVGTLNVMVSSPNNKKSATLWSLSGQQGNSWLQATVPISQQDWTQDYQVDADYLIGKIYPWKISPFKNLAICFKNQCMCTF